MDSEATCMLRGVRILDAADDTVGLCGKLLADLGASVTRVQLSESAGLRPQTPHFRLNRRKPAITVGRGAGISALGELLQEADVLIENVSKKRLEPTALKRQEILLTHSRLIHLVISPFGCTGPKKHYRSSATVISAAGGEMFVCRDAANKPSALYGAQPYLLASLFGAISVLMLLIKRRITGKGSFTDLSIQEAVASAMNYAPGERAFAQSDSGGEKRSSLLNADYPVLPCSDGYIQLALAGNWQTLAEILAAETDASELLQQDWHDPAYRRTRSVLLAEILKDWTRKFTKQQLFELGQAMSFPWAPVCDPKEVFESPQLASRGFFTKEVENFAASKAVFPGSPYRFIFNHACPAPTPLRNRGDRASISETLRCGGNSSTTDRGKSCSTDYPSGEVLKGIRVLDLTRMLSGPYCTRILADFGAEVLKIQTRKTSTGAERNDTPDFAVWNRNKRSITLDLGTEEARALFLNLVSTSDIVIENYSPRVMANWRLQYDLLKEANPALIMLSLSAMGQTGPWKDYVGFAPTFHALSGLLAASSSTPEKAHVRLGYAHADIVAGLYGTLAILGSVQMKERTGQGCHIDLSCYESMCTFLAPSSAERRAAKRSPGIFPDTCYPCEGEDCWCAITIEDEAEWEEFCRIVADPELRSEKFSSDAGRVQNGKELNTRISEWTSLKTAQSVEQTLQEAGIAAYAVQSVEDLKRDPQLDARRFFVPLKHPVLREITVGRAAIWPCRDDCSSWLPAPSLGEANHDIFVKLLGISETRFHAYIRRGIIG